MLKNRILNGSLMGAGAIAASIWLPHFSVGPMLILCVLCVVTMLEFYRLLDTAGIPNFKIPGIIFGVALIFSTWWFAQPAARGLEFRGDTLYILIALLSGVICLRQLANRNTEKAIHTIAGTLLGFFYVAFLLNFIAKLLYSWGSIEGRQLVIFMIVTVKITDVGAYFVGCAYGKHRLIPHISPAKSWEGCVGGVATAVFISLAWFFISKGDLGVVQIAWYDAVIMGILLSITGIVGDLIESLFKRAAVVKDSSTAIKGMGGVLDVLDSLLTAAPVLYIYAHLFLK